MGQFFCSLSSPKNDRLKEPDRNRVPEPTHDLVTMNYRILFISKISFSIRLSSSLPEAALGIHSLK